MTGTDDTAEPLADGMNLSLRLRRDFTVTDAARLLTAARRTYRDLNPDAGSDTADTMVTGAADALYVVLEHAGLIGDATDDRLATYRDDGLDPGGWRAEVVTGDPWPLAPGPLSNCVIPVDDLFALPPDRNSRTAPAPPLITAPDTRWAGRGAAIARHLRTALGPLALRVDHIGSTAVPAMAAKPVYDIQVSVTDLDTAADAFDGPLTDLGFVRLPYLHDHVPAGHPDEPHRWAKRFWHLRGPDITEPVNLHCRTAGSPNERLALLFRDWLRAHPEAVPAYAAFKQSLAAAVSHDPDRYTDVKDPVVDLVAVVAEQWATTSGWTVR
ncbi:hypothetical protein Aph02nite_47740 [Actinoplanes philippinensis]|uniref:GrpB domain, predicted nucleotidyltransferase, UPF0157 family n=1 Tax=Actinoplanes philippinensis TaxID=35752 RepID=A0A1I2HYP2_9ACTN|nr:GrpB family protein [Actinoplanes philippinensis]GIE78824.1 hypothetical protein Aph02nite_47740 [Actinoplanes philippinensis]SFF35179.1 GrpB domain, predicted nucleotidyltransferase, UPF0157 family [Actinoplanes philippinensis]